MQIRSNKKSAKTVKKIAKTFCWGTFFEQCKKDRPGDFFGALFLNTVAGRAATLGGPLALIMGALQNPFLE